MTQPIQSDSLKSNNVIDKAGSVRSGEELDLSRLDPWLKTQMSDISSQPVVHQYSGGASNWTYCLQYPEKELILRRAPSGTKAKGAHDMGREYRLQQALKPVYSYVPAMLAYSDDERLIGSEFYVMEKLTGVIPRKNLPRGVQLNKAQTQHLCRNALDSLIELHQVDYKSANLQHLGKGTGYTQRQIEGWTTRYSKAKTWNVPSANYVMDWLKANIPAEEHICITHNDFRFDNLVLQADDPTHIIGVLDWELATLGDPLMDIGNSLAYWVDAGDDPIAQGTRRQPTHLDGMFTRAEVIEYYLDKTGYKVDDFTFYEVYGLFRLAAIAQQIYYRYHHKQTNNPAFKHIWFFVHYLLWRCKKSIKKARV
ncbi:phosphotransferase family protein [Aliiglaciecola sp. LCG003]|uniref:phosphotransferase family protein n=1 Tax=Aliiglaciecola sp. LCG003 TaxID=3053655 RepID=UPI0025739C79|nr:phosphotransferase family protein [Aliiglaciecola sp. LCG003]WJG08550.1 phosphotransferase family protein [Aliiglaciecola sp. LCG003]